KLSNLTVEERFAFNVSLRMFTRSIVIQRRVEDLQLGVESYQKRLNLTKPDTYRSDLKRRKAYTAYSNPKGFIYQNKDKKNRSKVRSRNKFHISYLELKSMNATLEAKVLTRSSHSSRTSYAVAADLSEMELKKILIEKMEGKKSIQRSDEQRNLYKAKDPSLDETGGLKDEENEGSMHQLALHLKQLSTTCQMEEPSHPVFETSAKDQPIVQTSQHPKWFSQPKRPPSPDRDCNKTLPDAQGNAQSWISVQARQTDARSLFNELFDTPIYFSNFIMNRLGVDTLTPELLAGPTYELMRGSCQQYPHNLLQPLLLIPDNRGRRVIPFEHFINNDLEYLGGGADKLRQARPLGSFSLGAETGALQSNSSRTSYAVAADLTEMELKKILIEKIGNKSIQRFDEQQNLYKALVDPYEADKTILESYGDTSILKRRRGDDDDQKGPSVGSDRGSKRRREGGEHESASTPFEPATTSASRSAQTWISDLAKQVDSRSYFNELLDTLIDFSNFIMNRLCVDTLTLKLLVGPTFELMRGSCTSLTELEYHLEEVYKATTDQLDWVNPEDQQYPHNLLQPLSLKPDNQGRRVIPFEHFISNDLEYLRGGALSQKYTTSVTKTKAADYGHIKWIEDLVPRTMWIQEPLNYDKHAFWGVTHWGQKRQQFYGFAVNRESALDVYSKRRIIAITDLKIVEWHNYKHLDWISDIYKEYRHPATCGRSSTGSRKLPEEAQPNQARHVPIRSKVT
nr:hypothetical protein [Tanacetum cinerariifolium]